MRENINHMKIFQVISARPKPLVLITAGVHGDEYEPMIACRELIRRLHKILVSGSVIVIPVVNQSAYSIGSRYGQDGMDLARVCPGNKNGTETEVAASEVSQFIQKCDYYIDLHTGGRLLNIYPLAGYMLHSSEEILQKQREIAKIFGVPVIWGTDNNPEGRTLSIARDAGVPAIYVESGGGAMISHETIQSYIRGCINVLSYLGMVNESSTILSKIKYMIEDPSPDSGYLQKKMPAPAEGIFIPSIGLGESVKKGQKWGIIINALNGNKREVKADNDGIVLFIRTPGFIKKEESLGGILPFNKKNKSNEHV